MAAVQERLAWIVVILFGVTVWGWATYSLVTSTAPPGARLPIDRR